MCCPFLLPTSEGLIISAIVIGFGVAMIQVAFPGMIKREFSQYIGPMMGLYSAMLMGGGALGAWLAPHNFKYNGCLVDWPSFFFHSSFICIYIGACLFTYKS